FQNALVLLDLIMRYALSEQQDRLKSLKRKFTYKKLFIEAKLAEGQGRWNIAKNYYEEAKKYASFTSEVQRCEREITLVSAKQKEYLIVQKEFKLADSYRKRKKYSLAIQIASALLKKLKHLAKAIHDIKRFIVETQREWYEDKLKKFDILYRNAKKSLRGPNPSVALPLLEEALRICPSKRRDLYQKALRLLRKAKLVKDMVYVGAGPFLMGSRDPDSMSNQKPQYSINLPAFYIDKYEVTNRQYKAFLHYIQRTHDHSFCHPMEKRLWPKGKDHTPKYWYKRKWNRPDHPVVGVDWFDAYAYARWKGKRLPTEQEWEKAASWDPQKQIKYRYPWGNKWDKTRVAHHSNGATGTKRVGTYRSGKSPYGAYDMAGNVWEWTVSWYQPYPGASPGAEHRYGTTHKVARGGSWDDWDADPDIPGDAASLSDPRLCKTTYRYPLKPKIRSRKVGFRCVRDDFKLENE
ncbi:MAG: formylglycine-generating enzyme family protein, partial [Planctomycetota bacterium]